MISRYWFIRLAASQPHGLLGEQSGLASDKVMRTSNAVARGRPVLFEGVSFAFRAKNEEYHYFFKGRKSTNRTTSKTINQRCLDQPIFLKTSLNNNNNNNNNT